MRDIEKIIRELTERVPGIVAGQLSVAHAGADDDGVWFFSLPGTGVEVQLESADGSCPFLVEDTASAARDTAHSTEDAVRLVVARLGKDSIA